MFQNFEPPPKINPGGTDLLGQAADEQVSGKNHSGSASQDPSAIEAKESSHKSHPKGIKDLGGRQPMTLRRQNQSSFVGANQFKIYNKTETSVFFH
ncbi:MAG: hypothetical protein LBP22_03745 [Deltaproteobacteria bacterium]|jgi:hypothetical protein|nr:hypothetical protein [Deltaproteobacteria bacterium]